MLEGLVEILGGVELLVVADQLVLQVRHLQPTVHKRNDIEDK